MKLLESWRKDDKPFHEIHSFPDIMKKVKSQQIMTIIGGPGSGKTATIRHIALLLQTEFDILPISSPFDIIHYGNMERKQLFTLDDVFGVFGIERSKYITIEDYKDNILNVLGSKSKILFTCRKTLYKEASQLESFVLSEKCIVDLEDTNNQLNNQDKTQILNNHCLQNGVTLGSMESPNVSSKIALMMYPLLCKLFCSDMTYRSLGTQFFENPSVHILRELNNLQKHKKVHYAALVLCMFSQNEITKDMLKKKDHVFVEKREDVFESCRVNARNSEIQDALFNMEGTFTAQTKNGYSLIHDSVYEVLAYHYGNKNQEQMLQYMSSNFVAKKTIIGKNGNTTNGLYVELKKEHYSMLAERLLKDLISLELHDVFMNDALKEDDVCEAFLDVLKRKPYQEVKTIFFSKQDDTSKIVSKSRNVGNEVESKRLTDCELDRQKLLVGEMLVAESSSQSDIVRVISWVIYYGHSKILRFLFNKVLENHESITHVVGWRNPSDDEEKDETVLDLTEQTRLLTLSCFSGELEVVKLLLQYCDAKCINNKSQYTCHMFYDHRYITPLTAACAHGHKSVVEELIRYGANIDQQDEWGVTALYVAAESGHLPVVETLIEAGANSNECDLDGISPLFASAQSGHSSVVEALIKHGSDYNKPDIYKMSPLYVASQAGHTSVVDLLIKYGADCNKSDLDKRTPLHIASKSGHLSIVKALIKNGADINECDIEGKSPLFVAMQQDRKSVGEILAEHGAVKSP